MAVAAFDTLTVSKDLQQAGIQESHAEAIALAVKQGQGDLATKQDIALLKTDIDHLRTELKADIDHLRTELKADIDHLRTELKTDIDHLRTELKTDIDHLKTDIGQLRTEMKSGNDQLRSEMKSQIAWMKWTIGAILALSIGTIATVIGGVIALMPSL